MSRVDELNRILRDLQSRTPDIEATALVSDDGLLLASALPRHIEELRVAGISSTLLSLSSRAATELERGPVEQVVIGGAYGYSILVTAAHGTLLLVLTTATAKLGLVFLNMERAVEQIKKVL